MEGKKIEIKLEGVMVSDTGLATSIVLDGDTRVAIRALPALIAAVISTKNNKDRNQCAANLMMVLDKTLDHLAKMGEFTDAGKCDAD